jgi:Fe-S-cluster-containing dehydrogenase component
LIANYGYQDASGNYFISIDTAKCDGCGECVRACTHSTLSEKQNGTLRFDDLLPSSVLDIIVDDYDQRVVSVNLTHRNRLRYSCARCKSGREKTVPPCVAVCGANAMAHSW